MMIPASRSHPVGLNLPLSFKPVIGEGSFCVVQWEERSRSFLPSLSLNHVSSVPEQIHTCAESVIS